MTAKDNKPNVVQPHPRECPFVDRTFIPNPNFNIPKEYDDADGKYIFYLHYSGFEEQDGTTPKNVQFCKLIGRKKDVFECLNDGEWHECPYYKTHQS